jgi:hypothetical protein
MRRLPIVCAVFILAAQGHRHSPLPPTTLYTCSGQSTPSADLANIGGRVSVTGTCSFTGDLILDGSGTTSISTNAATFNLAGNLVLSGATSFIVVGGVFRLASQFVFQYSISTSDRARFEMQDAELSTNDGSVAGIIAGSWHPRSMSPASWLQTPKRRWRFIRTIPPRFPYPAQRQK